VKEIGLKNNATPIKISWKIDEVSNTLVKMTIGNGKDTLLKAGDSIMITFKI